MFSKETVDQHKKMFDKNQKEFDFILKLLSKMLKFLKKGGPGRYFAINQREVEILRIYCIRLLHIRYSKGDDFLEKEDIFKIVWGLADQDIDPKLTEDT